jgi:hypothetical protein
MNHTSVLAGDLVEMIINHNTTAHLLPAGFLEARYQYQIKIRGENLFGESAWSNPSSIADGTGVTLSRPEAVASFGRDMVLGFWSPNVISLSWTHAGDVGGADTSKVMYSLYGSKTESEIGMGEEATLLKKFSFNDLSFNHTGLTPGDYWYYKLFAKNRGVLRSEPLAYSGSAMSCPLTLEAAPVLVNTTMNSLYMTWVRASESIKGYDADAQISYKLYVV